ncbi:MAG TPA: ABC transporter permease subunit [Roseiflexaceae bacterium]|nr:ABC transporter permease subunit [Roseiflexaceae bacterium]
MFEFNPILVKELRSRMRGARAFVLLTVYLLILSSVTLLLYSGMASNLGSDLNAGRQIGKALFLVVAAVALVEVCVITPALTSGSIAGEKERQTFDLLVASLLSPWQIVWGKLASALAFVLLLILAVVPVMSLAFLFGGVSAAEVLIALAGLVATAVFYASVGLFWSSVTRSSLGATSFALGSIIMLLLGVPFLVVIFSLVFTRDVSSDLLESVLFIYASRLFIATHPFIALGVTESQLSSGGGPFFEVVTTSGAELLVPSPWILYVLLSALFSITLVALSVRMLQPSPPPPPSARWQPREPA